MLARASAATRHASSGRTAEPPNPPARHGQVQHYPAARRPGPIVNLPMAPGRAAADIAMQFVDPPRCSPSLIIYQPQTSYITQTACLSHIIGLF